MMNATDSALYNSSNHPSVQPHSNACEFTTFEFIGFFYVHTIVCLIGGILNIINIIVFAQKRFSATVYIYMSAISFTDATKLLVMSPVGLGRCAGHLEGCNDPTFKQFRFHISYFHNYVGLGIANSAETASAWLTVLVSIERYMAMKFPMQALTYCRQSSGKMHVIIVILLSLAFNTPHFFTVRVSPKNITSGSGENRIVLSSHLTAFGESKDYDIYTWFRFVLAQIIPLIALCIFNSLLLNVVSESYRKLRRNEAINCGQLGDCKQQERNEISHGNSRENANQPKQQRSVKQMQTDRRQRAQTKLTIMQICVVFLFLIGQIPQAFAFEKISNVIMPKWCGKCCKLRTHYQMISIVLSQVGFSLPFFIYLGLNRYFRKTLFTCCNEKTTDNYTRASRVA
ncbi:hypothetical protein Aperf_G00000091407 [Anoplocephala perfoliata]